MDTKALADEKNLLHKINNVLPNSVYIFDFKQRNLVWMNDRVRELYGYTLEEIRAMGKEFYANTMHPHDIPVLLKGIQDAENLKDEIGRAHV